MSYTTGPEGMRVHYYDYLGTRWLTIDAVGHAVTYAVTSTTNYSAVTTITPNGNASLATNMGYSSFLGLQSVSGPNGASSSISYDAYARPQFTYSPHGAVTSWTYTNSPPTKTGTTNGHWEKTTYDGLGRVIKAELGEGGITRSIVETEYDSCACSPLGKVKRVSQPYAPGGTVYWTTYSYDGLGRVTSVAHPNGTGTTSYVYEGNTVTVSDPAGKWKKFETDVFGNLTKVTEANPSGGNWDTQYTYNLNNQLRTVTMTRGAVTQTRTFTYDPQWRLQTATNPETGTVTYTYNSDNTLANKVDAKNQKVEYVYDGQQRVTQVKRYPVNGGAEDTCQQVNYSYDANPYGSSVNVVGRLAAVQWGHETACSQGRFTEMYGYTAAGLVTAKTLRLSLMNAYQTFVNHIELTASYGYNNEGKLTSMGQPGYYTGPPGSASGSNGEQYTWSYDGMGRLNSIQQTSPANVSVISGISYNAANQMTQINYGTGQVQTRAYNERLQMTRMTVAGVMDLEYRYSATQNNGQITSMKNYVSGEEVNYTYDSLKRLVSAVTTGPEWGQAYGLDGFGNLLSKTVTKGSAPTWSVAVDGTTNRVVGYGYDANGNTTSIPGFTLSYDVENRLVQTVLGGVESYGYGPDNKRVWRTKASGDTEFYFYGLSGERQGIYRVGVVNWHNGSMGFFRVTAESVIPKGMQADRDRLGSVVSGGLKYDPYGAEFTVTAHDRDKFGTYYRDSNTGFNYADQRYYGSSGGRFLTPEQYMHNPRLSSSTSWNLYAYADADPINNSDPTGMLTDPCAAVGCLMAPPGVDGTTLGGVVWLGGPLCSVSSWLPVPACLVPVALALAPPPQAPKPAPLECVFNGATIHEPGWGQADNLPPGYHMPINFNFTASGGSGSYTWSNTQTVNINGTISWTTGSINLSRLPRNQTEHLTNQASQPNGTRASFFDAPGLSGRRRNPDGTVVSASVDWTFRLEVSVSSGGQTVQCPTVIWSATLRWRTVDGEPQVTGAATVSTRGRP